MTKKDKRDWQKAQDLTATGFTVKPPAIRVHNANETPKHLFVKAMLAFCLQQNGRKWDTEVGFGNHGIVDVLDLGPVDGQPVVYEVETGVTDASKRAKVNQYTKGPVRDVIVIDPADVPDTPAEAVAYLDTYEVIG